AVCRPPPGPLPAPPDVTRAVADHGVGREDRPGDGLPWMMAPHPRQLRTPALRVPARGREALALDRVACVALEIREGPATLRRVAGRQRDLPAERHAAGPVDRPHRAAAKPPPDRRARPAARSLAARLAHVARRPA